MSRADWSFLEHLLEEGQEYSTAIGRIWLTVLFLFRILVLGTAAESAWDDEQADFVCNTKQPGCTSVCYDKAFPISHFRYFVLQVIFVSTPSIFYYGYVAIRGGKDPKAQEGKGESGSKKCETVKEREDASVTKEIAEQKEKENCGGKRIAPKKASAEAPKLKGRLLRAYAFSILLKVFLEAGFIAGLWFLYDGFFIAAKFECTRFPCPHTVDCFVSRPTEKTIFTVYAQVIAGISLLLNLIELIHLLSLAFSYRLEKWDEDCLPLREQVQVTPALRMETPQVYNTGRDISIPTKGREAKLPGNPCESYAETVIEVNWDAGETGDNLLPSYMNCMKSTGKASSKRCSHSKHSDQTGTDVKGAHKGHAKNQKQYV
ncbi:gap junction alpha-4 protein [Xiphophorus couchianus]|uniref:gap junction alpha-4 protein n=1 Tax=Xiphophorus couchianus TaxID=32473 RepID=UPI001015CDA7|nr:gap junction alpha-4 protein-like [Xiphophorus couchianus]